jgi:hypothetical protein
MSFDFKQHPTEQVRLSTQMQCPDHAAPRTLQGFRCFDATSEKIVDRLPSIIVRYRRPTSPGHWRPAMKSWETKASGDFSFG